MASILRYTASSSSSFARGFSTSIRRAAEGVFAPAPAAAPAPAPAPAASPTVFHRRTDPHSSSFELPPTNSSSILSIIKNVEIPSHPSDPSAWWRTRSRESSSRLDPGNQYSGRSIPISVTTSGNRGFAKQFRHLGGVLNKSSIKRELKVAEFYEKPSDRRRRVESERHRRRFQELVRSKVQLVQAIRSRN